jgi:cold shock CspA family protein/ribosome-associated translation inhibitor RaiA
MTVSADITFRHMEPSALIEERIHSLTAKLERYSRHIMGCHVTVGYESREPGNPLAVKIVITLRDAQIEIHRTQEPPQADPSFMLYDAFRAARHQLHAHERTHPGGADAQALLPRGWICELNPEEGFGRIASDDGRMVSFHRNSVQGKAFEKLVTGTEVSFDEEPGGRAPLATVVHVLEA